MPPEQALYRAFDLTIASQIALPELDIVSGEAAGGVANVVIRMTAVDGPMPPQTEWRLTRFSEGYAYFAWQGVGRFCVSDGRAIEVDLLPDVDPNMLGLFLLGPVMAALLHQRGDLVLHGSAVEIAPGATALFVGDNGAGKSTLAAAFLKAGHRVLSDDVIALDVADHIRARAAFPAMKLSRAALAALAPLPGAVLPPAFPEAAKLRLRFADTEDGRAAPLSHIYVVQRGADVGINALDRAEGLGALMRYSYMPKFGVEPLSGPSSASYFRQCAAVANSIPVSLLSVPEGFGALSQVVDAVQANAQKYR